jgi:hypothetical protein
VRENKMQLLKIIGFLESLYMTLSPIQYAKLSSPEK